MALSHTPLPRVEDCIRWAAQNGFTFAAQAAAEYGEVFNRQFVEDQPYYNTYKFVDAQPVEPPLAETMAEYGFIEAGTGEGFTAYVRELGAAKIRIIRSYEWQGPEKLGEEVDVVFHLNDQSHTLFTSRALTVDLIAAFGTEKCKVCEGQGSQIPHEPCPGCGIDIPAGKEW